MKKLWKVLLVLVMAVSVVACGGKDSDKADSNKEVVEITVAVSPDYPPYESKDKDGNIVGFDADMVALFADYLSDENTEYKFVWQEMSFDQIVTQIQAGQADLGIAGFTYSKDRKVSWSDPYAITSQVAVVNPDSDIKSVADLEGKKIAAQTGTTGADAAATVKDAEVVTVDNAQQIFESLKSNQYDAVVVDYSVALNYVNNQGFVMLEEALLDENNFIVAKEGNEDMIKLVNKALEKFIASDDYQKLCDKWEIKPLDK